MTLSCGKLKKNAKATEGRGLEPWTLSPPSHCSTHLATEGTRINGYRKTTNPNKQSSTKPLARLNFFLVEAII